MKKQLTAFLLIFALAIPTATIVAASFSGRVTDADTGSPIPNVLITSLVDEATTKSGITGEFELKTTAKKGNVVFSSAAFVVHESEYDLDAKNVKVELAPRKLSAATARWLSYIESEKAYNSLVIPEDNEGWNIEFTQEDLKGDFAPDESMIRRDPSAVIKVDDLFYTYYTRGTRYHEDGSEKFFPWDECDVWYATSKDGLTWDEGGPAAVRGPKGEYDDQSVFTPEILAHDGKYYLVYQCVKAPYVFRVKNTVGMAVADSPKGPFKKLAEPILVPTNNGKWDEGEGHEVVLKGDFDSHKVHDPCLMFYNEKFYLYYKGEVMGEEQMFGQREIKWGVAISDKPTGPYVKSAHNPLTNSGHEVCVWPYNGGIALIHTDDGPERHTIQWAADGIHFQVMGKVGKTPKAFGIYRGGDHDLSPTEGIRWGLGHAYGGGHWRTGFNYIRRFKTTSE